MHPADRWIRFLHAATAVILAFLRFWDHGPEKPAFKNTLPGIVRG